MSEMFAKELEQPSRAERIAWTLGAVAPLGAISSWSVLVANEHGFELPISSFIACGMLIVCAPVMALTLRAQRVAAARVLAGRSLLARWRCDPSAFAQRRRARRRSRALVAFVLAAICGLLWLGLGAELALALTAVLALVLLGMIAALQSQRLTAVAGEVWITREAMLLDGEVVAWTGAARLDSVALDRRDDGDGILFQVSTRGPHGREQVEVRAPVPRGQERSAKAVIRALHARQHRKARSGHRFSRA